MNDETVNTWLNRNFVHAFYVVIIIALVLYMKSCSACPQPIIAREEKTTKADTSDKVIAHAPVQIEAEGKITPRPRRVLAHTPTVATGTTLDITPDSGVVANNSVPLAMVDSLEPFTASLDTTVGKDSIHAEYDFPENKFRIAFKRAADTVQVINTTETITRYIAPDWYEKPLFVSSATAAAIVTILLLAR